MSVKSTLQLPELQVSKCTLHKHCNVDAELDKLSNSLEVRLRHRGCSREHHFNPGQSKSILGRILTLRESTRDKIPDEFEYKCHSLRYTNSYENDSLSYANDSLSYASHSTCVQDLARDSYDMEQIRQARKLLIRQRYEILNDPQKMRAVDLMRMRHCLRQYHLLDKLACDYDSDSFYT